MGLEKMRKQSRMGSRGETLPICTWEKHNHITSINSQGHTIGLTVITKVLGLYYIHGGILLLLWWTTRKIDWWKTP